MHEKERIDLSLIAMTRICCTDDLYHAFVPWNLTFRATAQKLGAGRAACYCICCLDVTSKIIAELTNTF